MLAAVGLQSGTPVLQETSLWNISRLNMRSSTQTTAQGLTSHRVGCLQLYVHSMLWTLRTSPEEALSVDFCCGLSNNIGIKRNVFHSSAL